MASERDDNKLQALADRLRGVGKELSGQGVGKVQSVQEIAPPKETPKMVKDQGDAGWQRQLSEEQKQALAAKSQGQTLGTSPGAAQKNLSQPEQNPVRGADGVVKNKALADIARNLREVGVSEGEEFGLSLMLWGGCVRTVYGWHGTFIVNSICHRHGYRNYQTKDGSRNSWLGAILAQGEAWHNNHHAFPKSAAHGHRRFEFDPVYLLLRVLEKVRIVWNVVRPPTVASAGATQFVMVTVKT